MIYYLTPFCPNKRLGYIHNQYCALVPNDDDYICLLDPDTMFLHPYQQAWIESIVKEHGNEWDLLGCMTNRIGNEIQCYPEGDLFDERDINWHRIYADKIYKDELSRIEETNLIAGFFMLFKKSLWNRIKFEEIIQFDMKFCNAVKSAGGKIGIMKGIYIWHSYRLMSPNPKTDKNHLLNK